MAWSTSAPGSGRSFATWCADRGAVLLTVDDETRHGSLCIDRIQATHDLRLTIQIGRVTPIHAGAREALLAFLDEALVADVFA